MGERWKQAQVAEVERLSAEVTRLETENASLRALLAEDGVEVDPEPDALTGVNPVDPAESLGSEPPVEE